MSFLVTSLSFILATFSLASFGVILLDLYLFIISSIVNFLFKSYKLCLDIPIYNANSLKFNVIPLMLYFFIIFSSLSLFFLLLF